MSQVNKICFYHSADADGWCSAAQVYQHEAPIELYGINYGQDFPWEKIGPDTDVFMVDFGLQPFSDMERLQKLAKSFIWIDHHQTAIDDEKKSRLSFDGIQRSGDAACELVWEYYNPGVLMPDAIRMLGRYDVWKWEGVVGARELQFGLAAATWHRDPYSPFWAELIQPENLSLLNLLVQSGNVILSFQQQDFDKYAQSYGFVTDFVTPERTYKVLAINRANTGSFLFESFKGIEIDFLMNFVRKKNEWAVSLYEASWVTNDINCGKVAKQFGGGGHKGAAGFSCEELPIVFGDES